MIPTETWFPVVTLLMGTVLGGVLEALRDRRAMHREAVARHHAQGLADRLRRQEFQRATLLSLQDECTRLTRIIGQMHHHDMISFREGKGGWGKTPMPDDLSNGALAAMQNVNKLRVRLVDDDLRKMVAQLGRIYSDTGLARTEEAADAAIAPLSNSIEGINDRVGMLLRQS